MKVLFQLGQIVATRGVMALDPLPDLAILVSRHASGDWGDALDPEDRITNNLAVVQGARIMSAYTVDVGSEKAKLWVITEAVGDDGLRASTCVLLPYEY
ncbi:MAG: hypothetical protein FD176_185 [Rhodospirillaceae bacterium]|nr:MAG: hypothetical protein FD176_185 [Rhodospirillaceae bacterium]TNC98703.1 MAG: hypothetical protein FD119_174 [Stygiobacter sp.]